MDINTILQLGGSALGGGAVFKAFDYFLNVKKEKRSDFDMINARLNDEIKRLYLRIGDLEKENKDLESRVRLLEGSTDDLPFPLWHQSIEGNYIWTNQTFNNAFLLPLGKSPDSIINKKDDEIWSIETVEVFKKLETRALQSPNKEASQKNIKLDGKIIQTYTVFKYPLYVRRILVGFGGIAFHEVE